MAPKSISEETDFCPSHLARTEKPFEELILNHYVQELVWKYLSDSNSTFQSQIISANATIPMNNNASIVNSTTRNLMTDDTLEAIELIPILEPTALRTNPLYSIYFNWFRFIAIGVMPFGLLVSFVSFE